MKYVFDNDLHIHSKISSCSDDPEQTNERILRYAIDNNLRTICLTNHFWDENVIGASEWYKSLDYARVASAKPLPQVDGVNFLFGCEIDLNKDFVLGMSKERFDSFDFVVVSTTHFHMTGFTLSEKDAESVEGRAGAWSKRLEAVLNMSLPFNKIGFAHLTCPLISPKRDRDIYLKILESIPEREMERIFSKAAQLGAGIELNYQDMCFKDEEKEIVLRPYRIAKNCGCKFYMGSDAHHPDIFESARGIFERAIDLLDLKEEDKFCI